MKLAQDETGYILVGDSHPTECFAGSEEAVAAYAKATETINGFWRSVNSGAKVTCCEVVAGKYRFKVCVGMPEHIEAYMDYVEPQAAPAPVEPEMQYINRRDLMPDGTRGDGALWPTFCPITSPGWVQIGSHPIAERHEAGDAVLIYDRFPKPEQGMERARVVDTNHQPDKRVWVRDNAGMDDAAERELLINFSKGDHLSQSEREAWEAEAAGY